MVERQAVNQGNPAFAIGEWENKRCIPYGIQIKYDMILGKTTRPREELSKAAAYQCKHIYEVTRQLPTTLCLENAAWSIQGARALPSFRVVAPRKQGDVIRSVKRG